MRFEKDRSSRYFGNIEKELSSTEVNILNKEYELSSKTIENQKDSLLKISNLFISISSVVPTAIYYIMERNKNDQNLIPLTFCIIIIMLFIIQLIQLSNKNKTIFRNAQKLIITRKALGLDFSFFHPIIPKNTVEGARNPFEIKLFKGFFCSEISSLLILNIIGSSFLFAVLQIIIESTAALTLATTFFLFLMYLTRRLHLNNYENLDQVFIKYFSKVILRLKLEESFGWIIYRVQLSHHETKRMNIDLKALKEMILFIEDRRFYSHNGISLHSIIRASYNRFFTKKMKSGASTITQQLTRTLFIIDYQKTKRRKIIEMLLATLWVEKKFNKEDILNYYMSSVRYARNTLGITDALRHYFDESITTITYPQAFFLAERIGNINNRLLTNRINSFLRQCLDKDIISREDIQKIFLIYKQMAEQKKINTSQDIIKEWKKEIDYILV